MRKLRNQKGFTMAELLLVVGIIIILMAVSFISVNAYRRSLEKKAYDGYAKEIFIAAQNHLSLAKSQGYLGKTDFGAEDPNEPGVYYFVVNVSGVSGGKAVTADGTVLNLMLPSSSLDETVRQGGQYIIRYHKDSGQVLDVFYWSPNGRYAHTYSNPDYAAFLADHSKSALKDYGGSVIGWYGSANAANLTRGETLAAPTIRVVNGDKLTVTVTDPNGSSVTGADGYALRLIVKGVKSGAVKTFTISTAEIAAQERLSGTPANCTVTLDDVTATSLHFCKLIADTGTFIPGEFVTVQAVALNTQQLTNVAYSAEQTANSLFGDATEITDTTPLFSKAEVSNFRHLENLDSSVSGVNNAAASVQFNAAEQTTDLTWGSGLWNSSVTVYDAFGNTPGAGSFLAVTPGYALNYDGGGNSVTGLTVTGAVNDNGAGMFGTLKSGSSVHDLKLVDFSIANTYAGALAGNAENTAVTNVAAYNSASGAATGVSSSGTAGGLIGRTYADTSGAYSNSKIENCSASLTVSGSVAGGLVGSAECGTITDSYSGGRTTNGKYSASIYNVTGVTAGGLVGSMSGGVALTNTYSTCSAGGSAVAGGLVGSATGGSITNSYSVGLVGATHMAAQAGVFIGTLSGTSVSGSAYLDVSSYASPTGAEMAVIGSGTVPSASDLTAMDSSVATFNTWAPQTGSAVPYDGTLRGTYGGKYDFRPISASATHYGDWPAVETLVINQ